MFVSFLPSFSNFLQPSTDKEDTNKLNRVEKKKQMEPDS